MDRRKDRPRPDLGERADAFLTAHGRGLVLLAAVVALAVLAAWIVAKTTGLLPHSTSHDALQARRDHPGPVLDAALTLASLGDAGVALVTVAVLTIYSRLRGGVRAAVLPAATAAVVVFTTIAKDLPGRETSLPSGHAAYAAAIGGFAAWLLLRAGHPRRAAALFALGLLMAPARVIEGVHEPLDVVAGAALGVAWLLAVLVIGRPWAARAPAGA